MDHPATNADLVRYIVDAVDFRNGRFLYTNRAFASHRARWYAKNNVKGYFIRRLYRLKYNYLDTIPKDKLLDKEVWRFIRDKEYFDKLHKILRKTKRHWEIEIGLLEACISGAVQRGEVEMVRYAYSAYRSHSDKLALHAAIEIAVKGTPNMVPSRFFWVYDVENRAKCLALAIKHRNEAVIYEFRRIFEGKAVRIAARNLLSEKEYKSFQYMLETFGDHPKWRKLLITQSMFRHSIRCGAVDAFEAFRKRGFREVVHHYDVEEMLAKGHYDMFARLHELGYKFHWLTYGFAIYGNHPRSIELACSLGTERIDEICGSIVKRHYIPGRHKKLFCSCYTQGSKVNCLKVAARTQRELFWQRLQQLRAKSKEYEYLPR